MTPLIATIAVLFFLAVIGIADLVGQSRHLIGWKVELVLCAVAALLALFAGTAMLAGAPT